jgi:phosphoenolpyruvate carboxykinase (GTP)
MLFGGRRGSVTPLIYESFGWEHGIFVASTIGSETTAAQTGAVGVVRRDPMAMLPFCGYNMGDYFQHWFDMADKVTRPPKIFCVNWFRKNADGDWLWPGFGDNIRPILWALERARGEGKAVETPIGFLPTEDALNLDGLEIDRAALRKLLTVRADDWRGENDEVGAFFERFDHRLPDEMVRQLEASRKRLDA